jgi:tetratricopeptide (TPR) repeat protein
VAPTLVARAAAGSSEVADDTGPLEPSLRAGTVIGRYTILERIGAGGMGVVYAVLDPELDRKVAVKLLRAGEGSASRRAKLEDRLVSEARAMAQLAHPNVVGVFEIGRFGDQLFLAMEFVEGHTLHDWLAEKPRSWREIVEVFAAAGEGLATVHAAGLVHRDFKPTNVLVGRDGRPRVTDFGLVQDSSPATARSAIAGTPYFMSPEQFRGEPADARSDQFSFCVALFAALHGVRPFEADPLGGIAGAPSGRLREPRSARRVPRRIRAALRRGLAVEASARFPSMRELLAELTPRSRRGGWSVALGAGLCVLTLLVLRSPAEVPDQRCTGAAAAFATVWNAERRSTVERVFRTTDAPYATFALHRVTAALDRYARQWIEAHTDACRASEILGEQTEATLDLRMICLDHRRQEAAALIGALGAGDAAVVSRSTTAVAELPDIASCADVAALRQVVAPPEHAAARAKLAELSPRLADARATYLLGLYTRARELIGPITAEARTLGYRPFQAQAELLQGLIEIETGDMTRAKTSLDSAIWSAEAGREDEVAARAWIWLVFLIAEREADHVRGLALVPRATAAIARLGGNAGLESFLERTLGAVDTIRGSYDSGIQHLQRAIDLGVQAFGPDDASVASAQLNLGSAVLGQGHPRRALSILERGRTTTERLWGPDHPRTAQALRLLGIAHNDAGDPRLAENELRRTLAIGEATLGPQHRDLTFTLTFLAEALDDQGRFEDAIALDRRAVAIAEKTLGLAHPVLGEALVDLGVHLGHGRHHDEAYDQMRRGEAILAKANGPDDPRFLLSLVQRGNLLSGQARWRDALALYHQAIPALERAHFTRRELTSAVIHQARGFLELHQPTRGLAALEELATKLDELRPDLRVAVEFTLARALWDSGGDRRRAHELASRALEDIGDLPRTHGDDIAQIERAMASHRLDPSSPRPQARLR